ncbi:putative WD40/YVTN repeat-like-containing domain superfamily [Septoria linicola]|nr:putative WD40/YVTN repeat-like-containing domain superfamily [Septoria linicola]
MDFAYDDGPSTPPPPLIPAEEALIHADEEGFHSRHHLTHSSSGPEPHRPLTRPEDTDQDTHQDSNRSYPRTEPQIPLYPEDTTQPAQLRSIVPGARVFIVVVSGRQATRTAPESDDSEDEDYGFPLPARKSRRMAIDHFPYPETQDLARPEKAFYPVTIPVSHWQLRHYISTPEPDHLYYASAHHIFCLNTATKKRKHIATLPFEARCTASGYGYVCVGGEDEGHFAAIKLSGAFDVDAALPLSGLGQNVTRRAPTVKVERIGEEIVNSISIHRIQDEEAHLDDIVAVLTNNDRTVRIYSLPTGHETKCKDIPFAVNHATISPDGQILVAVGDYNQAYFYKRVILEEPPQIPKPHNRLTSASLDWKRICKVTLHVSGADNTPVGYFTTAWNASASLVAVGSEGGYITIIDRAILEDDELDEENRDEAVVAVVPGSRADHPSPHPGAIRSMVFSPDPWDLLIWSEDQGRVCVGDLRTGLKSRQIINLEPKDEEMERYEMEIVDPEDVVLPAASQATHLDDLEADLLRRYRAAPDNASAVNFATEYIEARRRQREHRQALAAARQQVTQASARARLAAAAQTLDDDPQGLTSREQQILETLRTTRQREEARSNGQIPRSVNYTTPDMFTGPARSGRDSPSSETTSRPISEILSSVQDNLPTLERIHATSSRPTSHTPDNDDTMPPLATMREALAAWNSGGDLPPLPRGVGPRSADRTRAAAGLSGAESSSTPRSRQSEGNNEDNPWTAIEEQLGRGPLFEGSARANAASPLPAERDREAEREARQEHYESIQNDLDLQRRIAASAARNRERWRSSRLAGSGVSSAAAERAITMVEARRSAAYPDQYEALIRRTQLRNWGSTTGREIGVRTAGLAVSPDGRTLWAGCEEGIFEIDIKTKARMFLPSLDPR